MWLFTIVEYKRMWLFTIVEYTRTYSGGGLKLPVLGLEILRLLLGTAHAGVSGGHHITQLQDPINGLQTHSTSINMVGTPRNHFMECLLVKNPHNAIFMFTISDFILLSSFKVWQTRVFPIATSVKLCCLKLDMTKKKLKIAKDSRYQP
jgi:hypothetical protein